MRYAVVVARILLGLVFFVFGLDGFLHFIPAELPTGPAGDFVKALMATGYMIPLLKGTETVAGALLLIGRFVPLALTLLAAVIVNILFFHVVFGPPSGLPMAFIIVALEIFLAWAYRANFRGVLAARAQPAV